MYKHFSFPAVGLTEDWGSNMTDTLTSVRYKRLAINLPTRVWIRPLPFAEGASSSALCKFLLKPNTHHSTMCVQAAAGESLEPQARLYRLSLTTAQKLILLPARIPTCPKSPNKRPLFPCSYGYCEHGDVGKCWLGWWSSHMHVRGSDSMWTRWWCNLRGNGGIREALPWCRPCCWWTGCLKRRFDSGIMTYRRQWTWKAWCPYIHPWML